jgi:LuxR family maltose regulon positive regulatory protein
MSGEGFTLLKWVEAVETYAQWHPWLAVLKAWAFALTGRLDRVESTLQMAEGLISSPEASLEFKIMLGSIAAVRAYLANQQGDAQLAANFAQSALEYLPDGNEFSCSIRSVAVSILGDASLLTGNLRDARQAYLEATRISQAAGNIYMSMIANTNLAVVLAEQGHLRQAARVYTETLKLATRPDGQRLPLADRIYAGLAEISYEWNDLEVAERYTHLCIELCRQWGNSDILAKAYLQLAWLERVKGDLENALEALRAAEQISAEGRLSLRQSVYVSIACACWRLAQGNLEGAIQFVQQSGVTSESLTNDPQILDRQGHAYILLLRLLLAQGDHEGALSLAGRLLHLAEAAHRTRTVIEILVLQALVLQAKKDLPQAIQVLERAVTLARPEGFVRVFLDEGEPMAKLLYQAKNHRVGDQFISELLTATGKGAVKAPPLAQVLIEPLTLRELEVLRLIESGCANQEIADRLVISIPTVKRHISNIYAKLGAKSRTHAISLGRELNLLQ